MTWGALALQSHQLLQHGTRHRNFARIGLVGPLRHDHVGVLLCQVHFGGFERSSL